MNKPERITLENIGGGVASELFQREIERVLENIEDINTNAKDSREINLKISFKPTEQRDAGMIEIKCTSRLVGTKAAATPIMIVKEGGKEVLYQQVMKQGDLNFGNVVDIPKEDNNAE